MGGLHRYAGLIRLATSDDIPIIAKLGQMFFNESGYSLLCAYDAESVEASLNQVLETGVCLLVVAEKDGEIIGFTGALLFPLYMNINVNMAQELFWWVHPDHRKGTGREMLGFMETELKAHGVTALIMICLENVNPEITGKLYERRGYKKIEHHYMRLL